MFIEIIEKEKYPYTIFFGGDYYKVNKWLSDYYISLNGDPEKMKELKSILDGVGKHTNQ